MTFLFLRLLLLQIDATTQNNTNATRIPTPTPILVAIGQEFMFVETVVWPVVGDAEVVEAEVGFVSVGFPPPVVVALFEPPATAVGAGVAAAMPY